MKQKGIAIIGRMTNGLQSLDGQTVKTKTLYDELQRIFPDRHFVIADMYQYKKHIVRILWQTLYAFITCEHIFVLLSKNGRKFFFPLLTGLNHLFHRRLYHDVIGGALPDEAKQSPALQKHLKQFDMNWVEFDRMKQDLHTLGVDNVEVLPNFKRLSILQPSEVNTTTEPPFLFSTFSRVMEEKGISDAIRSTAAVNEHFGKTVALLHIYGPVHEPYQQDFDDLLAAHADCVCYKGCVPQDESVAVLRSSHMLLFPTHYKGEGMPGTIVDAFSSGLPVLATNWHFNEELVHHMRTGYCYDWNKPELLTHYMIEAVTHPEVIHAMRMYCLEEVKRYTPEIVMETILHHMNESEKATV